MPKQHHKRRSDQELRALLQAAIPPDLWCLIIIRLDAPVEVVECELRVRAKSQAYAKIAQKIATPSCLGNEQERDAFRQFLVSTAEASPTIGDSVPDLTVLMGDRIEQLTASSAGAESEVARLRLRQDGLADELKTERHRERNAFMEHARPEVLATKIKWINAKKAALVVIEFATMFIVFAQGADAFEVDTTATWVGSLAGAAVFSATYAGLSNFAGSMLEGVTIPTWARGLGAMLIGAGIVVVAGSAAAVRTEGLVEPDAITLVDLTIAVPLALVLVAVVMTLISVAFYAALEAERQLLAREQDESKKLLASYESKKQELALGLDQTKTAVAAAEKQAAQLANFKITYTDGVHQVRSELREVERNAEVLVQNGLAWWQYFAKLPPADREDAAVRIWELIPTKKGEE